MTNQIPLGMIKLMTIILISTISCQGSKGINNNKKSSTISQMQSEDSQDLIIQKEIKLEEQAQRFKIKEVSLENHKLKIKLNFSGGCVDQHAFNLYSSGKMDKDGIIDLFLLRETQDNCKMLLIQERIFDIGKISKKKNFKLFRINQGEPIAVQKTK